MTTWQTVNTDRAAGVQSFPDGDLKKDGVFGDMSPYVCNGPRVHEYLQEMNRRVLSRYDLLQPYEARVMLKFSE